MSLAASGGRRNERRGGVIVYLLCIRLFCVSHQARPDVKVCRLFERKKSGKGDRKYFMVDCGPLWALAAKATGSKLSVRFYC